MAKLHQTLFIQEFSSGDISPSLGACTMAWLPRPASSAPHRWCPKGNASLANYPNGCQRTMSIVVLGPLETTHCPLSRARGALTPYGLPIHRFSYLLCPLPMCVPHGFSSHESLHALQEAVAEFHQLITLDAGFPSPVFMRWLVHECDLDFMEVTAV
jgi:hypothetical protein